MPGNIHIIFRACISWNILCLEGLPQ